MYFVEELYILIDYVSNGLLVNKLYKKMSARPDTREDGRQLHSHEVAS